MRSADAEAVFLWGTGTPAIIAAKGFKAQRMPGNLFLLNLTIAQITAMGDAVDVVRVAQTKANVYDQIAQDDPVYARMKPFVEAATKANVPIDTFSSAGYGAVFVFEDAIRKVGPDPQKIFELWNGGYEPPATVARIQWNSKISSGLQSCRRRADRHRSEDDEVSSRQIGTDADLAPADQPAGAISIKLKRSRNEARDIDDRDRMLGGSNSRRTRGRVFDTREPWAGASAAHHYRPTHFK